MHKHQVSFLSRWSPWSDTADVSSSWPGPLHGCTLVMTTAVTSGRRGAGIQCKDWQPTPCPTPSPSLFLHPLYLLEGLQCAGSFTTVVPTFWAPGTSFMEENFAIDCRWGVWFQDESSTLSMLCTLLLLQELHLRSSGINPRGWRPLL